MQQRDEAGQTARSVTIVIPTYNNLALLRRCLQSVRRLDYPAQRLAVLVVDNGSTDGTSEAVHAPEYNTACLRLEHNTGFAEACNRGAAEASSEYVAFLNDDATADPRWLHALFAGLDAGGEGAVCAASTILSGDGSQIEYNGASSNLFGVGRPRSVWGWPGAQEPPREGSPLLFASGGAMLIHRRTFLDSNGFDPSFFAYFEDVDLGWRLWVLGHKVVYAPAAVVRHIGGSTGSRQPAYRRYTLWECNSLATVLKNYESGTMERLLSAALLLLYKRALLSAGDAFKHSDYRLTSGRDDNAANVERLPRASVAHLAAINRFNSNLQGFMRERRRIQALRVRSDSEILPLLGRLWEPQFAGTEYAEAARRLAASLDLYGLTQRSAPNRVLVLAGPQEEDGARLATTLVADFTVALATVQPGVAHSSSLEEGFMRHHLAPDAPELQGLAGQADAIIALPGAVGAILPAGLNTPLAWVGVSEGVTTEAKVALSVASIDDPRLVEFCRAPRITLPS